jgi:hypothetical protein
MQKEGEALKALEQERAVLERANKATQVGLLYWTLVFQICMARHAINNGT